MAVRGPIPVEFGQVFPHGAYVTSEVEPMYGFVDGQRGAQQFDDQDRLLWQITVLDADPEAKGASKSVKVKLAAKHQPIPPAPVGDNPFPAVEFEGLSITPYVTEVMQGRFKVAYSLRASGLRSPKPATGGSSTSTSNGSQKASAAA